MNKELQLVRDLAGAHPNTLEAIEACIKCMDTPIAVEDASGEVMVVNDGYRSLENIDSMEPESIEIGEWVVSAFTKRKRPHLYLVR